MVSHGMIGPEDLCNNQSLSVFLLEYSDRYVDGRLFSTNNSRLELAICLSALTGQRTADHKNTPIC